MSLYDGSGWPRRKLSVRVLVLLTVTAFLNLEVAGLLQGRLQWPAAKAAQQGRQIAAFLFPERPDDRPGVAVLTSILRNRCLAEMEGVQMLDPVQRGAANLLQQGQKTLEEGVAALDAKEWLQAKVKFEQTLKSFEGAPGLVDARAYARALKGLGIALFQTGAKEAAQDFVARSLLVFPQQNVDQYAYTLEGKVLFRTTRAAMQDAPTGNLDVKSVPDGAEVHLDYNLKGHSPLNLSNLTAGNHHLRLVRDGYTVWEQFVQIRPGAKETTTVNLIPMANLKTLENGVADAQKLIKNRKKLPEAYRKLREITGAKEMLLAQVSLQKGVFKLRGVYFDESANQVDVEEDIPRDATLFENLRAFAENTFASGYRDIQVGAVDSPGAETGAIDVSGTTTTGGVGSSGTDADLVIDPNAPFFNDTSRAKKDPVYKKWWFWTIIGVCAAGAGTGLGLLLTSGGEGGSPGGTIRVNLHSFGQ